MCTDALPLPGIEGGSLGRDLVLGGEPLRDQPSSACLLCGPVLVPDFFDGMGEQPRSVRCFHCFFFKQRRRGLDASVRSALMPYSAPRQNVPAQRLV